MDSLDPKERVPFNDQRSTAETSVCGVSCASGDVETTTATTSMTSILSHICKTKILENETGTVAPLPEVLDGKGTVEGVLDIDTGTHPLIPSSSARIDYGDMDELSELGEEIYYHMSRKFYNRRFDERVKKAPKQVAQIVQYTRLMEERMQVLEREVRELKDTKNENNTPKSDATERKVLPPRLLPDIRRATWSDYGAAPQTHAIDVLYGEPDDATAHQSASEIWKKRKLLGQSTTQKPSLSIADKRPTRIKILSELLRIELRELTSFEIGFRSRDILSPFKPFVLFEERIRGHTQTLIDRLNNLEAEVSNNESFSSVGRQDTAISERDQPATSIIAGGISNLNARDSIETAIGSSDLYDTTSRPQNDTSSAFQRSASPNCMVPVADSYDTRVLSGEERLNPQDIGRLMYSCNLSRKQAVSKLKENDHFELKKEELLKDSKEEDRAIWGRHAALFEARILVHEWKSVISLLDNELSPIFKFRDDLRNGKVKEVSFNDLPHIFEPGQYVVPLDDKAKMLRVFSVTGGRRLLNESPRTDAEPGHQESATETAMAAFKTFLQVSEKFSPLVVDCYQFDFDGTHFGPVQTTFRIKRFEDVQKIDSLAVFPANFISDVDLLKRNLRARGKKFLELCSLDHVVHKEYEGLSLDNPPEQIESQIIVDFDMASRIPNEQQPKGKGWVPRLGLDGPTKPNGREINGRSEDCKFSDCPFCEAAILDDQSDDQKRSKAFILGTTHLSGAPIRSEHLNGEDCMLLNARVLGFVLRNRKWARLHVDNISPVERHENNFDKLVLPRGYRKIVRALVETHFKTTDSDTKEKARHNADLVRGKGKGLIILLHGAPGVGKTSTAECVAEHTQRPLFAITCGDIGETAAEVEKNLDRCFQMAHRWGCVLLLDEADVFLAQRDKTDLRRNAIVSVFLRVLEYYAGILFLTTNRVGSFDQAFKSRIHMSLLYPILDQKSTRKIWQMNLDRAIEKQKELGLIIDKGNIMDFADDHWKESEEGESGYWNGRQIRNAFQTAIALAQWERKESNSEAIELNRRHFIKVSKAARSFDAYLNKVYGGQSEAEKAVELSERFDKWDTDEVTSKKHAKYKEKRIAGKNVAFFGGSKKGKDKKSKKEESCSDSESDSPQQRRQKKFSESESITDE